TDDRPHILVHLFLRQVLDIPPWDPGHTNVARIEYRQPQDVTAKLEERPQRIEDRCDSSLTTTALVHFPAQAEYVSCIQPGHRQVPDVADYPAERFAVSRNRGGRAPRLVTRPLYKRGSAIPMVIDGRSSSLEAICLRSGGVVIILAKEVLVCLNG